MCTIETNRIVVGLVIVHWTPLNGVAGNETVGLWTIVLIESEDMVQAYRHHVVDASFTASQHNAQQLTVDSGQFTVMITLGCRIVAGVIITVHFTLYTIKCLGEPLLGDRLRGEVWIPGEAAKGIPVGLGEMMTTPVGVETNVGYSCDTN